MLLSAPVIRKSILYLKVFKIRPLVHLMRE